MFDQHQHLMVRVLRTLHLSDSSSKKGQKRGLCVPINSAPCITVCLQVTSVSSHLSQAQVAGDGLRGEEDSAVSGHHQEEPVQSLHVAVRETTTSTLHNTA